MLPSISKRSHVNLFLSTEHVRADPEKSDWKTKIFNRSSTRAPLSEETKQQKARKTKSKKLETAKKTRAAENCEQQIMGIFPESYSLDK